MGQVIRSLSKKKWATLVPRWFHVGSTHQSGPDFLTSTKIMFKSLELNGHATGTDSLEVRTIYVWPIFQA